MRKSAHAITATALLVAGAIGWQILADSTPVDAGERLFGIYCAVCHGERAEGNGPLARDLVIAPPNLTLLSVRDGGTYPADRVYRTIDGRLEVRGHGTKRMPIWGLGFQMMNPDTNQEAEVRTKIVQVVRYLQSVQKKKER